MKQTKQNKYQKPKPNQTNKTQPMLCCHHWILNISFGFFVIVGLYSLNGIFMKNIVRKSNISDRSLNSSTWPTTPPERKREKVHFAHLED